MGQALGIPSALHRVRAEEGIRLVDVAQAVDRGAGGKQGIERSAPAASEGAKLFRKRRRFDQDQAGKGIAIPFISSPKNLLTSHLGRLATPRMQAFA